MATHSVREYQEKADDFVRQQKYQEAISCYDQAIKLEPTNANLFYEKASVFYDWRKHEEAVGCYDEAIRLNPKDSGIYYNKASSLNALKRYEEAIACYDQANRLRPDSGAFYNKAGILSQLGRNEEALVSYDEAIKLEPTSTSAFYNKASVLTNLKRYEEAIICYDEVLRLKPTDTSALYNKGGVLYNLGRYEDAVSCYDKLIKINPRDTAALYNKGGLLSQLGKYEEAIACYDAVLKLDASDTSAAYNKAVTLDRLKKYEEALSAYDELIKRDRSYILAYCNKARILQMLDKDELALECLNIASELAKNPASQHRLDEKYLSNLTQTLDRNRTGLIKKVAELQHETIEVAKVSSALDASNEKAAKLIKVFEDIKEKKKELTKQAVDSLDGKSANTQESELVQMSKKMDDLKQQMQELLKVQAAQQVQIDKHENALDQGGVFAKAAVKEGFSNLEQEDTRLYIYCKTFYWTTINLFGAYRSLSTGLIQGNIDSDVTAQEDLLVQGAQKLTSFGAEIAKGIPFVGGLIGALDGIITDMYTSFKAKRFNNKVTAINTVIQKKFDMEEDISLSLAQLALAITQKRKQLILYPNMKPSPKIDLEQGLQWLNGKIESIKGMILPAIDLYDQDDESVTLALGDVTLMMAFLCANSESVVKSKKSLDIQCAEIIDMGGFEKMIEGVGMASNQQGEQDQQEKPKPPEIGLQETSDTAGASRQCCNMF